MGRMKKKMAITIGVNQELTKDTNVGWFFIKILELGNSLKSSLTLEEAERKLDGINQKKTNP